VTDLDLARLSSRYRPTEIRSPIIDAYIQAAVDPSSPAGKRALRGIPVIANGVPGTAPGTNPVTEILSRTCYCGREKLNTKRVCKKCARGM
jgi:hypothetical protein